MRIAVVIVIVMAAGRVASADCDQKRERLAREAERAQTWNLAWSLSLTGLAIGQAAIAITPEAGRTVRATSWIGAGKAAIGAASHWIAPLRVAAPTGSCADVDAAITRAAAEERNNFWLIHLGGFAVNAAGAIALGELTSWRDGVVSFALGYPVALAQVYTLPRWAWHVAPSYDSSRRWGLSIATTF